MIEDSLKLKLIALAEPYIITSLVTRGYVIHNGGEMTWDNVSISETTLKELNITSKNEIIEDSEFDEFITELMSIFPKGQVSSKNTIKGRYKQWQKKCQVKDISYSEILQAATEWVSDKGNTYCGKLIYFFFKEENKIYDSRLENQISIIRENNKNTVTANISPITINWGKIDMKL